MVSATSLKDGQSTLDEEVRRSKSACVSETTMAQVQAWLQELKPRLELRYGLRLGPCETPQFLVYREGDFFGLHRDSADDPGAPLKVRQRRVSVVFFLNGRGAAPGPDVYGGGWLLFFDFSGRMLEKYAKVSAEPGLMVAFPSWLPHMVSKVQHGTRYSIVSWFPGEGSEE